MSSSDKERIKALDDKIARARQALEPPKAAQDHHSMAQTGWRMVIELVTGLGIGAGMGYGLDVLMGTQPLMLVLLTLLGFAAGVRVMMRTAKELETKTGEAASPDAGAGAEKGDKTSGG